MKDCCMTADGCALFARTEHGGYYYSVGGGVHIGERERLYWLPLDRPGEYDVRPSLLKRVICGGIPESFERYVNDGR